MVKDGFLQPVIRSWYIAARPDATAGESTAWYAAFWPFCAAYLRARFGERWCLSPEQSLSLPAGNGRIGRFLMNLMLASGGYPWTVIPLASRDAYMAALEDASVRRDIVPFARLLGELAQGSIDERSLGPKAPAGGHGSDGNA